MALAGTMLVLFTVMATLLLGVVSQTGGASGGNSGLMNTTSNSLRLASARMRASTAFNLAESGVEYTLQWLHAQAAPPNQTIAFGPPGLWNATDTADGRKEIAVTDAAGAAVGVFRVRVYPDASNPTLSTKRYVIESEGVPAGTGRTQVVRAFVQQANFGKYAYFTDSTSAGSYAISDLTAFDGPVHCNNADGVRNNVLWKDAAGTKPIWRDTFTCVASGINWNKNSIGSLVAPSTSDEWLKVASLGATAVRTNEAAIPMPQTSDAQMSAALGGGLSAVGGSGAPPAGTPANWGGFVPNVGGKTNGGVYLKGAVQNLTLSVDGAGRQVVTITQAPVASQTLTTTVTIDPASQQTVYSSKLVNTSTGTTTTSGPVTYTGMTNGVIYSDGDIGAPGTSAVAGKGLSGVIADNVGLTITTQYDKANAANCRDTYINGNLTYKTARQKDVGGNYIPLTQDANFMSKAGRLGIVSDQVNIVETDAAGATFNNVEVDAAVLAADTYQAINSTTRPTGKFVSTGSYIARKAGGFGSANVSGAQLAGLATSRYYDSRFADNPPPFFPTTSTQYDVISWQRPRSLLPN